ncbi:hypothetical protein DPMN_020381 [Dreissena polymorpha]|uniref:Uncharacterized protein n=2 Tax=Dreissena polymorpha TaxID=45954 RepID=A0A9D4NGQ3_DREPO|nr:hypothetical protein DPMN_020381 [Dreissena polymorpha]
MRSNPSTNPKTRTLEDTLCTTKSSGQQLHAPNCNVSTQGEKHTGTELARPDLIGKVFKTDNSLFEKENCKSNVTASKRTDVKFKYAESQTTIGFSDRAHETCSPSILATLDNLEINETQAQSSCIEQTGIDNESLQRMPISPGHTFQTTARLSSTPYAETRKQTTLHNTKTDIDNDKPVRKYFAKKSHGPCQDILADKYMVLPEKPTINKPTKSENNSHATFELLSATHMANSQERGSRNTLNKPTLKSKYIATKTTDFAVYTQVCDAKGNVVVSEKRSSALQLKTSDLKEASTQGNTNSNHSTQISLEHVDKSVTSKPEQVYERKPRMTSTLEGNKRTARPFPEKPEVTTLANKNRQINEIPLNVSTEKVRHISGEKVKVPNQTVSKDSVADGFISKSICSSNEDKKRSTDTLEHPARDKAVFRRSTSTTQRISKPLSSGANTTRTASTRGCGQVTVSGTRHITSLAAREEINTASASKHKNKVSVTDNNRHSIPAKADTYCSLTSATKNMNIYQEKAHKTTTTTNQRILSDTREKAGNTLREECKEVNVKQSNQLNDTDAAGQASFKTLPMKNMKKESSIEPTKYFQSKDTELKCCTDKHLPQGFSVRKSKPEPTKLSRPESYSKNKTDESIPMSALYYTDTDKTWYRRDTVRGVKFNNWVVSANLTNSENISTCRDTGSYNESVSSRNTPDLKADNNNQLQSLSNSGRRNKDPVTKCINKDTDLIIMKQADESLRMANICDGNSLTNKQYRIKTKQVRLESEERLQVGTAAKPRARIDQNVNEPITGLFESVHNQLDDDCDSDSDEVYVNKAGIIKNTGRSRAEEQMPSSIKQETRISKVHKNMRVSGPM